MTNRQHSVVFQPSGLRGKVKDGATVLEAAHKLGVDIESLCGGQGTCGKCRVRIEEGRFDKYGINSSLASVKAIGKTQAKFLNQRQLKEGYRLACRTSLRGDAVIFVPEQSRQGKQVIRKEVTPRDIRLRPAVKQYPVKLKPATLHDSLGDLERLQAALRRNKYDMGRSARDLKVSRTTLWRKMKRYQIETPHKQ